MGRGVRFPSDGPLGAILGVMRRYTLGRSSGSSGRTGGRRINRLSKPGLQSAQLASQLLYSVELLGAEAICSRCIAKNICTIMIMSL